MDWGIMTMVTKGQRPSPCLRRQPQRTCIGCRQVRPKGSLVRLVGTADGCAGIDPQGKKRGRGAYLCPNRDCWGLGLKGNRLEYALRMKLSPQRLERLSDYGKTLPGRE